MRPKRNQFLNPRIFDPEYLIMRLRRNDLRILIERYLLGNNHAIVLDFGSRRALYRPMFSERVKAFLAADFHDKKGSSIVDVEISSDGRLKQPSESVDVVLSLQVLEHVDDTSIYFSEIKRVLKPEGLLWLTTHGVWPYHPTPDDYYRWTLAGLHKTVEPYLTIIDTTVMMGGPAYALLIYIHILWKASLKLNAVQSKILNAITGSKRWGKIANRKDRIQNPNLYIGTVLFRILVVPLNIIMSIIDYSTPMAIKKEEAAILRIAARKMA